MDPNKIQPTIEMMKAMVDPWYQALAHPAKAQEIVLEGLLKGYSQTDYGRKHKSENVGAYADFKKAFPVSTFADFKPYLNEVMAGNTHALLSEEPISIGSTKGTTGQPKLFPFTRTHANLIDVLGHRMRSNFSQQINDLTWMSGYRLNVFPTLRLGTIKVGEKELEYGYSAAVSMKYAIEPKSLKIVPTYEEMDLLPKEPTKENWEKKYEFAYQKARDKDITAFYAMPTIALGFGRYIYREHHVNPKDFWQIKFMQTGGYPGGNTRIVPAIHALYGKSLHIWESYGATEGIFGMQLDDKKAWSPLYDQMFFEIQTISGIKQLHEMYPGEIGTLVVSTPDLPRYRIGDLIIAFEAPYFRCIGRENTKLHPYSFGKLTGKSALTFPKSTNLNSWR
jgi:acyl-CoA synthetase (AMP-forming)/AMP-acid ligase II